ncbi:Crp/Fnr family transcriptional regulator [Paenalkalicoccus suaedae]|uniref:Crp/Fnr family transcriptional regulator n=1 Tax=Paenalkalicoccus suaedae TaxID=2592382 RepID=A0A859FC51_9BACI|nr:Crp/Fnr family transcriptional regulator [Paenalkalicoccus suaedae]QKS70520.1 Crp/Fnr family transcriptional regulator [Paenalkalicoccus suaedae]
MKNYINQFELDKLFPPHVQASMRLHTFKQGDVIFDQADEATTMLFLVKGKIKIYTSSSEGKTLLLTFKTPLSVIGDVEFVQQVPLINTVEAVSDVEMLGISYDVLRKEMRENVEFISFLLHVIAGKFYSRSMMSNTAQLYPVNVRLASYLVSHATAGSDLIPTGTLHDTANLIGTSYRHLNRVIQQFEEDGLVKRTKQGIKITGLNGLRERSDEASYEWEEA